MVDLRLRGRGRTSSLSLCRASATFLPGIFFPKKPGKHWKTHFFPKFPRFFQLSEKFHKMSPGFINSHRFVFFFAKKCGKVTFKCLYQNRVFFRNSQISQRVRFERCLVTSSPACPLCPFPLLIPVYFPSNFEGFCPSFQQLFLIESRWNFCPKSARPAREKRYNVAASKVHIKTRFCGTFCKSGGYPWFRRFRFVKSHCRIPIDGTGRARFGGTPSEGFSLICPKRTGKRAEKWTCCVFGRFRPVFGGF